MKKYEWDFGLIYKNKQEIQKDIEKVNELTIKIVDLKGKLNNKKDILTYLKISEELTSLASRLSVYSSMKVSKDARVAENLKLEDKIASLLTDYSVKTAFVQPELCLNSDEFLTELKNDPNLKDYDRFFDSIIKDKPHTISTEKEALLAGVRNFADFGSIFDKLSDVEIKFEDIITSSGDHLKLNNSTYGLYVKNADRDIRLQAHKNIYKGYKNFNLTISQNFINHLKNQDFVAKTYNFKSCFDKALFYEEVEEKVYETLIKNVHKHLKDYQNYFKIKAKLLGIDEFLISDVYGPIGDCSKFKLEYDDAVKVVLDMVKVMGEEYYNVAKTNFTSRWVDVFSQEGKQSGAYSISGGTGNPFMLLNYNKTYNDISTIAHELGHSMHSYFSEKNQPIFKRDYVIFVAEVASTVNEVLLSNKLMREAKDENTKKFIAESLLSEFGSTVFRQTMFSEFEQFAHGNVSENIPISFNELNQHYLSLLNLYFKDSVKLHEYCKYEWSRIPHFYRPFYVYKYATGFISAVSIAKQIELYGKSYVENNYLKFLSAGCSKDPVSLLKIANVDITSSKPYDIAFKYFNELLDIINN